MGIDLRDKRVLITGGSKGIGKAIAAELLARGARVFLVARGEEALRGAKEELTKTHGGDRVGTTVCDVADYASVEHAINTMRDVLGGIDGMVCNAGLAIPRYFAETPPEEFERLMRVNYLGSVYPVRAAIEDIPAGGFVAFVSSVAGYLGVFGYTSYCPTKFAQIGFAESLRQEVRGRGIQVSVLCPPDADTPGYEAENETKPEETKALTATAALMTPEEVARRFADGLERGRFLINCNVSSGFLYRLNGFAPALTRRYIDRMIAKIQRRSRRDG